MDQIMRDYADSEANNFMDTFLWYATEYRDEMKPTETAKIFARRFEKMFLKVAEELEEELESEED